MSRSTRLAAVLTSTLLAIGLAIGSAPQASAEGSNPPPASPTPIAAKPAHRGGLELASPATLGQAGTTRASQGARMLDPVRAPRLHAAADADGHGPVYGWVWDRFTGYPTKGITVKIWQQSNPSGDPVATTTTGADGYYTFPTLAPGAYLVLFGGGDFISEWWDDTTQGSSGATVLTVPEDGSPVEASAALDHWGNMAGTVTNSKGKPLANAPVTLLRWNDTYSEWYEYTPLRTDSRGRFSGSMMAPGIWAIGALDLPSGAGIKVEAHYLVLMSITGRSIGGFLDPWIEGSPSVGLVQKVDVGEGSWKKTTFSYQWLRDGAKISKATKKTYTPVAADRGHKLQVRVTSKQGKNSFTVTSPTSWMIIQTSVPKITGPVAVGSAVSVDLGAWPQGTTFTFQWYADGKAITGATGVSLTPTAAQKGKRLTVKATGSYRNYPKISRTSAATAKVATAGTPTVTGTAAVGSTLKAKAGTWTKKTKFSYQWLRNGTPIRKATKSSYKLVAADRGAQISVRVTGKLSGYATVSKTSAPLTILT